MFSHEFVEQIADAVAAKVVARMSLPRPTGEQRLLDVSAAARYLGRSKQAIYHLVHENKLPTKRIGSRVFFDRHQLDAWVEAQGD
jgi:excisionase family DNA binding protein